MTTNVLHRWAPPGRIALRAAALGSGPLVLAVCVMLWLKLGKAMNDFRTAFYPAGLAVLHGHSPYPAHLDVHRTMPFVYPAVGAWLYAPLALFRYDVAAGVYFVSMIVCLVAALLVLGVRDPRCYTVILLWPAVLDGLESGAVGSLFVLGLAVVWRYRDRDAIWVVAALMGAVKLFVWPLGLYLLYTRRWRALGVSAASGLGFLLLPWAAIGFDGLRAYPHLLTLLAGQEATWSLRTANLALAIGLPSAAGYALAAGLAVLAFSVRHDQRMLMTVCVVISLAACPILWPHYFMLLLVPVALRSPRLSGIWFVPLVGFLGPDTAHGLATEATVVWWAFTLVMTAVMLRPATARPAHAVAVAQT